MPFNPDGCFTRILHGNDTWASDAQAGTKILSGRHDTNDNDLADGLSQCITKTGNTQPTANIPMGGHKITNLGEPNADSDAATRYYVDHVRNFSTTLTVSGSDDNGRLNFTGSGVTGIGFASSNTSWLSRPVNAGKERQRLVVNNSFAGNTTGAGDIVKIDIGGVMTMPGMFSNLSIDETGKFRTPTPGWGTYVINSSAALYVQGIETATATAYAQVTPRNYHVLTTSSGSPMLQLFKSGSGKYAGIYAYNQPTGGAAELRWYMQLGDAAPETGSNVGSNFVLGRYSDTNTSLGYAMTIQRATGAVNFPGDVTTQGRFSSGGYFSSTGANVVLSCNGGVLYLRPNGPDVATEQSYINSVGDFVVNGHIIINLTTSRGVFGGMGYRTKQGSSVGSYTGFYCNHHWTGSATQLWINDSLIGNITVTSDYRTKKDVRPLGAMWDIVKALRPIRYSQQAYDIFVEDDTERWGFVAHELQEAMTASAASGVKDGSEIQSPNPMTIIAALTSALQEAMVRIEALEARLAA